MSDMKENPAHAAVTELLESARVSVQIFPAGTALVRDGWEYDGWRVQFTRPSMINAGKSSPSKSETFDYFTGTGHRKVSKVDALRINQHWQPISTPTVRANYKRDMDRAARPVAPHVASVLHSLIMQRSAHDMSFSDWCSDYGYSSDSIKALSVYQACADNTKRMREMFTREELSKLAEILHDY
jgi:hypothetical protein